MCQIQSVHVVITLFIWERQPPELGDAVVLDQLCTWPAYPDAIVTGHVLTSKPTTALILEQHAALDTMVAAVIVGTDKPAMLSFVLQATGHGGDCGAEGVPSRWC
jgi:hypothetical protein